MSILSRENQSAASSMQTRNLRMRRICMKFQCATCSAAGATGSKLFTNFHTLESIKIILYAGTKLS